MGSIDFLIDSLPEATKPTNSKGTSFSTVQAAIDDMDVAGWVYVPPGTWTEAVDIVGKNNIMLFGAGWGMTKITYAGNDHTLNIDNSDDVIIRDIRIDQTSTGNNVYAIRLDDAQRCKIQDVYIGDSDADGIFFEGADSTDCEISGCYIIGADANGIRCDIAITNIKVNSNIVKSCVESGIYTIGTGHLIENNICESCLNGILIDSDHGIFRGNLCSKNTEVGIYIASHHNIVDNNICIKNSWGNSNSYDGIYVYGAAGYSTIIGNICYDDHIGCSGVGCQRHGIFVRENKYNIINGNVCRDNIADGIKISGAIGQLADYNTLTSNVCEGNGSRGIYIFGDKGSGNDYANKNIVVGNQLFNNNGTNLDDDGTATELGHNITA